MSRLDRGVPYLDTVGQTGAAARASEADVSWRSCAGLPSPPAVAPLDEEL